MLAMIPLPAGSVTYPCTTGIPAASSWASWVANITLGKPVPTTASFPFCTARSHAASMVSGDSPPSMAFTDQPSASAASVSGWVSAAHSGTPQTTQSMTFPSGTGAAICSVVCNWFGLTSMASSNCLASGISLEAPEASGAGAAVVAGAAGAAVVAAGAAVVAAGAASSLPQAAASIAVVKMMAKKRTAFVLVDI